MIYKALKHKVTGEFRQSDLTFQTHLYSMTTERFAKSLMKTHDVVTVELREVQLCPTCKGVDSDDCFDCTGNPVFREAGEEADKERLREEIETRLRGRYKHARPGWLAHWLKNTMDVLTELNIVQK